MESPAKSAEPNELERAKRKARDLLRLARFNPNVNEGILAARLAQQIAQKYALDLDAIATAEAQSRTAETKPPRADFDFFREVYAILTGFDFAEADFNRRLKRLLKQSFLKFSQTVRER